MKSEARMRLGSGKELEGPSFSYGYGALRAEFLAAETTDAVAITDLQPLAGYADRVLGTMVLADAALDALIMTDYGPRGQTVLERTPGPLG